MLQADIAERALEVREAMSGPNAIAMGEFLPSVYAVLEQTAETLATWDACQVAR